MDIMVQIKATPVDSDACPLALVYPLVFEHCFDSVISEVGHARTSA